MAIADWLTWLLLIFGLVVLFVGWDLLFCGGRRCREVRDRLPTLLPSGRRLRARDLDRHSRDRREGR